MKIRYFTDTDTLLMEPRDTPIPETRDLDENTVVDLDGNGNICAITPSSMRPRQTPRPVSSAPCTTSAPSECAICFFRCSPLLALALPESLVDPRLLD